MQKRLDVYLSENNTVKSRSLAASLIKQGSVEVNGRICTKASCQEKGAKTDIGATQYGDFFPAARKLFRICFFRTFCSRNSQIL